MLIKPAKIRFASLLLATILVLPLPLGSLAGIYIRMSPFILLNGFLSQLAFSWFNMIGLAILVMIVIKDHFFCRYLCPVGFLCDPVSTFARRHGIKRKFPDIARGVLVLSVILALAGIPVLSLLDPMNAFNAFFDPIHVGFRPLVMIKSSGLLVIVLINLVYPHSWCQKICPLGGLQLFATEIKRIFMRTNDSFSPVNSMNRRYFITGVIGAGAGLFLPRILKGDEKPLLRPPGIVPEDDLRFICSRCGNCLKTCPTKIIQPQTTGKWMALFTPKLDFSRSYCLPECNRCGDVCPTGAIRTFTVEQKHELFIGQAELTPDRCLLTKNQECDRCKFACGFEAIEMTGSFNFSAIPVIIKEKCVGCGACQVACPASAIKVFPANMDHPA